MVTQEGALPSVHSIFSSTRCVHTYTRVEGHLTRPHQDSQTTAIQDLRHGTRFTLTEDASLI